MADWIDRIKRQFKSDEGVITEDETERKTGEILFRQISGFDNYLDTGMQKSVGMKMVTQQ